MADLDTVVALAAAWSAWQDESEFPFSPDHCINGTRVVTGALGLLGVEARPVSVYFMLFNQFAWDLFRAGVHIREWPDHAWSLGVHPTMPTKGRAEGWDGHLVAEGKGWTLDISARAFHRPRKVIVDEPLVLPANLPRHGDSLYTDEHHQRLVIGRWPSNDHWRRASGWNRPHTEEVHEIVRRTEALLATERNNDD